MPIVEFIIIPLFPKIEYFLLNPLKGIAITYIVMTVSLITIITIDTVGHFITQDEVGCFLHNGSKVINMSYLYYIIPFALSSLVGALSLIFILEFIACQAPVNMSGMLTGMFKLIRAVYINIGVFLLIPFTYWDLNGPGKLSCSFWSLLIQLFICIFGLITYLVASRWYKQRQREESNEIYMRNIVVDNYMRVLDNANTNDDKDVIFIGV